MPPPLHHAPGMMQIVAIAELCRKEGIAQSLYYTWSKELVSVAWPTTQHVLQAVAKCRICGAKRAP